MKTKMTMLMAAMAIAGAGRAGAAERTSCGDAAYPRLICTENGCARLTPVQQCELAGGERKPTLRPAQLAPEEQGRMQLARLIARLG